MLFSSLSYSPTASYQPTPLNLSTLLYPLKSLYLPIAPGIWFICEEKKFETSMTLLLHSQCFSMSLSFFFISSISTFNVASRVDLFDVTNFTIITHEMLQIQHTILSIMIWGMKDHTLKDDGRYDLPILFFIPLFFWIENSQNFNTI